MGKKKKWLIGLVSTCIILAAAWGGVYAYGNQTDIPSGYALFDWRLGNQQPEQLKKEWSKKLTELDQRPIQFKVAEGVEENESQTQIPLGELGLQWNDQEVLQEILAYSSEEKLYKRVLHRFKAIFREPFELTPQWNEQEVKTALHKAWPALFEQQPVNAKRWINEKDEVMYEAEQAVLQPDFPKLMEQLKSLKGEQMWKEGPLLVELPLKRAEPTITVQDLKDEGIQRKISEFTTMYAANAGGRTHNVETTAEILNDTLLSPDEVFSYQDIVTKTEEAFGYKPAPVIMEGELRQGIGGGICQVSTTLYNAALLSDLEIVERRNHSLPIGYAPLGRDATFTSDGGIDFRFKNTTGKKLLIRTEAKNGKLTIKLFGTSPEEKEIEIVSETVNVIPPPTKVKKDASLASGQQRVLQNGKPGYQVSVYKRVKVNGEVVDQVLISKDTYRPQPKTILTGMN